MSISSKNKKNTTTAKGWYWVPSLYFTQGLPYVVVMSVSVIMYKKLEISNTAVALYTSWLYLPWVIKPLWSPLIALLNTRRWWVYTMQLLISVALAAVAFTLPANSFFQLSLAAFWLMAFASATHDIAADGFYMDGLDQGGQSFFVGIRTTFYRLAMLAGQGGLVVLAGLMEAPLGVETAWSYTFGSLSLVMLFLAVYHKYLLPRPITDVPLVATKAQEVFSAYINTISSFFSKPQAGLAIAFLLTYRLGEGQLVKIASLFLLDPADKGGLGFETTEVGFIYGTAGLVALSLGGILGGLAIARNGLKYWLWPMVLALNLPNLSYVALAYWQPTEYWLTAAAVVGEQFGYGFGFTAYVMYMIYISDGIHKTAHYALCTGFMALSMMLPGMFSGWVQEWLGYTHFFLWVLVSALPALFIAYFLKIPVTFGKKV